MTLYTLKWHYGLFQPAANVPRRNISHYKENKYYFLSKLLHDLHCVWIVIERCLNFWFERQQWDPVFPMVRTMHTIWEATLEANRRCYSKVILQSNVTRFYPPTDTPVTNFCWDHCTGTHSVISTLARLPENCKTATRVHKVISVTVNHILQNWKKAQREQQLAQNNVMGKLWQNSSSLIRQPSTTNVLIREKLC